MESQGIEKINAGPMLGNGERMNMRKVLSFIADYFDEREFLIPYYRLQEAGFEVDIAGPEAKVFLTELEK